MIRVIVRILLLPWIQRVIIQAIERYETNSFFSTEISWITDPSVQTNRPLIFMSLKINFKPLTIFSEIPILYAWPGCEMSFDACTSNSEQFF